MAHREQNRKSLPGARINRDDEFIPSQNHYKEQRGAGTNSQGARPGGKKRARENSDYNRDRQQHHRSAQRHHEYNTGHYPQTGSSSYSSFSATSITPEPPAVKEIPGFYFDPDKKKYFKITPNHAFGSQHPYSQQSIKEKTQVKPDIQLIKDSRLRFPCATPQYDRLDWFLQDRQLGLAGNPRRQLCGLHTMLVKFWRRHNCSEYLFRDHDVVYSHMKFDHAKQEVYLATSRGQLWRYHIGISPTGMRPKMQLDTQETSETTSLHLRDDNLLVTSYLGNVGRPGTVKVYRRSDDPSLSNPNFMNLVMKYPLVKSNIWSCDLDSDKIVIGGDRRTILLRGWESGRNLSQSLYTGSDVFSVEIDPPEGRNVVYAGCRNGCVRIFDLNQQPREEARKRENSLLQGIGHKMSPVNCMKRVSDHFLVTAAMNGEILMWDTRFVGGCSSTGSNMTAEPVLDIRGPLYNHEETLLAAGHSNQLSLWSLSTGDRIRDLNVGGYVGCLNFSKTSHGIWAAVDDQLQFWVAEG
ncbi:DDB1 and CUL4 associated factor 4-like 2 [Modicella reniformis]|uniref:DDB1 and CUL4 associated factor 4-like 2 n=1 Tax=Modicella reniformis TaxID=1440133 RepID=A0A9P6SVI5_9FUNG|nr:DDB1 and CUL4 associated factor 4-like 2 [Modicella reniformis]